MIKKVSHIGYGLPRAFPLGFASVDAYILDLNYRVLDSLEKKKLLVLTIWDFDFTTKIRNNNRKHEE